MIASQKMLMNVDLWLGKIPSPTDINTVRVDASCCVGIRGMSSPQQYLSYPHVPQSATIFGRTLSMLCRGRWLIHLFFLAEGVYCHYGWTNLCRQ